MINHGLHTRLNVSGCERACGNTEATSLVGEQKRRPFDWVMFLLNQKKKRWHIPGLWVEVAMFFKKYKEILVELSYARNVHKVVWVIILFSRHVGCGLPLEMDQYRPPSPPFNHTTVESVSCFRFLGVNIYSDLYWSTHDLCNNRNSTAEFVLPLWTKEVWYVESN